MAKHCPNCHDEMEEGVISGSMVVSWHDAHEVPGDRRSWKTFQPNKVSAVTIVAYKCTNCGHIELVAKP